MFRKSESVQIRVLPCDQVISQQPASLEQEFPPGSRQSRGWSLCRTYHRQHRLPLCRADLPNSFYSGDKGYHFVMQQCLFVYQAGQWQ